MKGVNNSQKGRLIWQGFERSASALNRDSRIDCWNATSSKQIASEAEVKHGQNELYKQVTHPDPVDSQELILRRHAVEQFQHYMKSERRK